MAGTAALELDPALLASYREASPAIELLQRGDLRAARRLADEGLGGRTAGGNPYMHLVAGTAHVADAFVPLWKHYTRFEIYFEVVELYFKLPPDQRAKFAEMVLKATAQGSSSLSSDVHWARLGEACALIRAGFDVAERHLSAAEQAAGIQLLLCPSCWHADWNDDGRIDAHDAVWQVEYDSEGLPIPDDDLERRRPFFRFDRSDIAWLRAMIAFQSGLASLLRGYDLAPLDEITAGRTGTITLRLVDPAAVRAAREAWLTAIGHARRARALILAETDDSREWLANPRQRDQAAPDRLTDDGFTLWAQGLDELEQLLEGKVALPIAPLVEVSREHPWRPASADRALDVGGFLREPRDIAIDLALLETVLESRSVADLHALLETAFGPHLLQARGAVEIYARWMEAIAQLDGDGPPARGGASGRYVVRRRMLRAN